MTGHAKDSGSPHTEDQKRYLAAVAPYNQIVDEEADTDTWTAERDVVVRSVPVVQTDEDSFDDALDDADSHDGADQARVIRVSLHLPPR